MTKPFLSIMVLLAAAAVAVADVFIKKAALGGTLVGAVKNPWFIGAVILYLFQIAVFTWAFVAGWQLSIVGILQTVLYAIIVLASGALFFQETLSFLQWIGIALALGGVILLNIK
ncbi:MAG: hypothetical protein HZB10_03105 [Candidatus Yonathbacteria bacterium]|nr:hypothetical protein [Candidatus Yonathbacteria bacterium]